MKSIEVNQITKQLIIILLCLVWLALQITFAPNSVVAGLVIVAVWLFSLCLHEYSHAVVAYLLGDKKIKKLGYLNFNILRYLDIQDLKESIDNAPTFLMMAIVFPVFIPIFILSIFPGGRVYTESDIIQHRWPKVFLSLSGPLSELVFIYILSRTLSLFDPESIVEAPMLSGLSFIITIIFWSILFNLIPFVEGSDGYQTLIALMPKRVQRRIRANPTSVTTPAWIFFVGIPILVFYRNSEFFAAVISAFGGLFGLGINAIYRGYWVFIQCGVAILVLILACLMIRYRNQEGKDLDLIYISGINLYRHGQFKEAQLRFQKAVALDPDFSEAWELLGQTHYTLQEYESATQCLKNSLELNSKNVTAQAMIGNSLKQVGQHALAKEELLKALAIDKDSQFVWESLVGICFSLCQFDEALIWVDRIIEHTYSRNDLLIHKCEILRKLDRADVALELVQELNSKHPSSYSQMLEALIWKDENTSYEVFQYLEKAMELVSKDLEANSEDIGNLFIRGSVFAMQRQYPQAMDDFNRVLQKQPYHAYAWYNLACCYAKKRYVDFAVDALSWAIAIEPFLLVKEAREDDCFDSIRETVAFQELIPLNS